MTSHTTRRDLLASLGGVAAARAFGLAHEWPVTMLDNAQLPSTDDSFPRRGDFAIEDGYTYLNAAYTHPIPRVSMLAAQQAASARGTLRVPDATRVASATPRALFAQLINAKPTEIAYVSSTSAGENLVTRAVELDHRFHGNVVTDGLHFEGSVMHLLELRKRGLDVRVVQPTPDGRIEMADLERAVDHSTRLVEISAAAMYNGFQHNLKAVADLAHAHGALVYVDMVHAAGAEPFDVTASGIDFASCSSFKWLMGDFGLGFLYARESVLDRHERPVIGYYQAADIEPDYPPFASTGPYAPVTYSFNRSAAGMFETGSLTGSVEVNVALLARSLEYVLALDVAKIQAHRLPMIRRLQSEMPRLGYIGMTPATSTAGNVTFARRNLIDSDVPKRLTAAKINVRVARHWMRISPSVYNDIRDIERLLDTLA